MSHVWTALETSGLTFSKGESCCLRLSSFSRSSLSFSRWCSGWWMAVCSRCTMCFTSSRPAACSLDTHAVMKETTERLRRRSGTTGPTKRQLSSYPFLEIWHHRPHCWWWAESLCPAVCQSVWCRLRAAHLSGEERWWQTLNTVKNHPGLLPETNDLLQAPLEHWLHLEARTATIDLRSDYYRENPFIQSGECESHAWRQINYLAELRRFRRQTLLMCRTFKNVHISFHSNIKFIPDVRIFLNSWISETQ